MSLKKQQGTTIEEQSAALFNRRDALKIFAGMGIAAAAVTASLINTRPAFGVTQAQIDAARSDYDAAQKLLDEISNEVSNMQASLRLMLSRKRFLKRKLRLPRREKNLALVCPATTRLVQLVLWR